MPPTRTVDARLRCPIPPGAIGHRAVPEVDGRVEVTGKGRADRGVVGRGRVELEQWPDARGDPDHPHAVRQRSRARDRIRPSAGDTEHREHVEPERVRDRAGVPPHGRQSGGGVRGTAVAGPREGEQPHPPAREAAPSPRAARSRPPGVPWKKTRGLPCGSPPCHTSRRRPSGSRIRERPSVVTTPPSVCRRRAPSRRSPRTRQGHRRRLIRRLIPAKSSGGSVCRCCTSDNTGRRLICRRCQAVHANASRGLARTAGLGRRRALARPARTASRARPGSVAMR